MVKIRTTNTTKILNMFRQCPFFLNGFVISGEKNLMLLFGGEDLASLESIIDERLRPDEDVQSADFNIIISSIKDFIMPIKMIERPLKELKGFKKIFLKPGEKGTITFELDKSDLSFYDEKNYCWTAEKGKFNLLIGSSSKDIRLQGEIEYL